MNSSSTTSAAQFHEQQQFRQIWIWLLLLIISVVVFVAILTSHSFWLALLLLIVDIAIVGFLYSLKLTTEVRHDGIHIRFFPMFRETIPFSRIGRQYVRTYRPILEYGGWGVRYGWKGKAYNVRGNQGVQLEMTNGKRLLIGSQRAAELAQAIEAAKAGIS